MQEQNTPQATPPKKPKFSGRKKAILGIIFAVISLGFFPPIFGALGIIMGYLAKKSGEEKLGTITIILSIIFMIAGFIIGAKVGLDQAGGASMIGTINLL